MSVVNIKNSFVSRKKSFSSRASKAWHDLPFLSRELRSPLRAFPNTARPILLKRLYYSRGARGARASSAHLSARSPTPRALYYSSAYITRVGREVLARAPLTSPRVPQHRAPYITQAPILLAWGARCSRELRSPLRAFPNTARPILLKHLLRSLAIRLVFSHSVNVMFSQTSTRVVPITTYRNTEDISYLAHG